MVAYRPEIDGLRAVAVIPVVLFHLGFDWISGGYLGVDVFFVISGYLITQIIVSDLQAGTFSYTRFISRRIRRIGPVLLAVVSAVLLVTHAGGMVYDFKYVAEQSISSLFFAANVYFWNFIGNYWGPTAEESVLLHTWSLSLEEQFYLVFPWALVLMWRMGRIAVVWSLALLMVGSVATFVYATFEHPQAAFYLLPTRAWELLCGSLLAVLVAGRSGNGRGLASEDTAEPFTGGWNARLVFPGVGMTLIVFAYFLNFDQSSLTANRFAAVIGSLMILAFPGSGSVFKLLSWGPCVWIGKLSYSIYMWHWPLIVWSRLLPALDGALAVGGAILFVSVCSYYIIEQPTRRRAGVVPWIVGSFLLTCILAFGVYCRGLAPDVAASGLQSPVWHGARFNLAPRGESPPWVRQLQEANVITPSFERQADAFTWGGLIFGPGDVPEIVVLGDSHAAMWSNSLLEYANRTQRTISLWSIHGVDPFVRLPLTERSSTGDLTSAEKVEYDRARLELIERWQPKVVILAVRWPLWGCEATHDLLRFLGKNAGHVLLLGPVPESDIGDRIVVQYLRLRGQEPRASQPLYMKMKNAEMPKRFQAELEVTVSQYTNVSVVPLSDLYSRGENVLVLIGNQTVYLDDDHLTEFGAQLGKQRLADAIEQAMRGQRWSP